jgi:DNA excision repair protein ERCC-3
LQWLKKVLAAHPSANTLIYCDSIQYGKTLSKSLDLPFIYGDTPNKFERVLAARQRIVSKAIEASLDLPDLERIIEVDVSHTGRSPVSAGQRIGRAMHSRKRCEYYLLLTPDEYARFGERLVGIEMQLGDVIE